MSAGRPKFCRALFLQECSELGIKGKDITRELTQLLQQLPGLYQEALSDIDSPDITSAMEHYAAVTAYAHSPAPDSAAADPTTPQQQAPTDPNRLLSYLHSIRSGNELQQLGSSPSDAANGPSQAANSPFHAAGSPEDKAALETGENQEIQWDITEEAGDESLTSSHGPADVTAGNEGGGDIDWDVAVETAAETTGTAVRNPTPTYIPANSPPLHPHLSSAYFSQSSLNIATYKLFRSSLSDNNG